MTEAFIGVCRRDLRRFARNRNDLVQPVVFFLLVVTLMALGLGLEDSVARRLAPTSAWVAVVLALTINLDAMFAYDAEDGTLEQLVLSPASLALLTSAKLLAHWLATALPQIVTALVFCFVIGLDSATLTTLLWTLLLGTPVLTAVGAVAAALTVGLHGAGILIALIAIPLYVPVLIFATAAVNNALLQLPSAAELYFLGGLAVLAISLTPFAAAAALRIRLA